MSYVWCAFQHQLLTGLVPLLLFRAAGSLQQPHSTSGCKHAAQSHRQSVLPAGVAGISMWACGVAAHGRKLLGVCTQLAHGRLAIPMVLWLLVLGYYKEL